MKGRRELSIDKIAKPENITSIKAIEYNRKNNEEDIYSVSYSKNGGYMNTPFRNLHFRSDALYRFSNLLSGINRFSDFGFRRWTNSRNKHYSFSIDYIDKRQRTLAMVVNNGYFDFDKEI